MSEHHLLLVDLHRQHFPQTCYGLNEWRHYIAPGVWHPISEFLIRRALIALARGRGINATSALISSALSLLQDEVFVPAGRFDSDPSVIPVANGVLEIAGRNLRDYQMDDYITTTLPFAYDPDADASMWNKVISHLEPESRDFLQEWTGVTLTPDTHHELAMWLYGPPGGGKSTFIDGIQTMLGNKGAVLGLDEIARSPFALSQIVGKNLLICTEQPAELIKYAHTYIKLISGEPVTINPKHLPAFEYRPHAKIISAMNKLPSIDSASVGLFRRIAPLYWPAVPEADQDVTIKEQIRTQAPAILNWGLDGLDRLRARGRFAIPTAIEEARNLYKANHSNVLAFIAQDCTVDLGERVQASELYSSYELWCVMNDETAMSPNKFHPEVDQWFKSVKPGNVKHYLGLTLGQSPSLSKAETAN